MPSLLAAVREALTESIRVHGVIVPVVKDQTGYVLDGHNRIVIATDLDVDIPAVTYRCEPEQREILRVELNGARRQIGADDWKPLVDHLRRQVTPDGVRRFSDRVIARAVGVDKMTVHRYKSPALNADVSSDTSAFTTTEDGKVRHVGGEWTAPDRVLHLLRQSTAGLTAADLLGDEVLAEFGPGTVGHVPGKLRDKGLVEEAGKRGRSIIWRAVPENTSTPSPPQDRILARKVSKILDTLGDPTVRDEAKAQLADRKDLRQAEALLRAAEKESEAARLAQEKREADEEKERLRLIELSRSQADKSVKTWDKLTQEIRAAWTIIASYSQVFDDLPAVHPSFVRMLDRELDQLRQQLDWFDKRLHPEGRNPIQKRAGVIDV